MYIPAIISFVAEQYFLDGGVILVQKDGELRFYKALTDIQGSVLSVYDIDSDEQVFRASYDAWGRQVVEQNDINLQHGYCGHDMLSDYDLIDMGGRVYDPVIGRFLSCDNYVQEPDNSQNFNRYSYCLNNPLRYTDPTGELFGIDDIIMAAAIGGMINTIIQGMSGNINSGGDFLKSYAIGAFAGGTGACLGAGVNVAMAGGSFWSGAAGLANGISSTGFLSGLVSGASAGFAGGFITGAGNSWMNGSNFWSGLGDGLASGGMSALTAGITGGVSGGLDAVSKGCNFWDGTATMSTEGAYAFKGEGIFSFKSEVGKETITGTYVGQFEGQSVYESPEMGNFYTGNYSGVTIPERGIMVGKGVYTSKNLRGYAMMQHEFGHIRQYRLIGPYAYYHIVAPESLASAKLQTSVGHDNFWTEKWANYLSKEYFGKNWLGYKYSDYPAENISLFNKMRIIGTIMNGMIRHPLLP